MKRVAAVLVVGLFLLATVVGGSAIAHVFVAETSLSILKLPRHATDPGAPVVILGKLHSPRPACRSNKVVKLMRRRPGPDKVLARDRTDREGEYRFIRHPRRDQTVYTKFSGTFFSSYLHSHRCLRDRSDTRFINVRR
jgi:hypothetical protein